MNYGNLEGIFNLYSQLKDLKLKPIVNIDKYANLATMRTKLQPVDEAKYDIIPKYMDKEFKGKQGEYHIAKDKMADYLAEMNPIYNKDCGEINFIKINFSDIREAMKNQPDFVLDWNDDAILFLQSNGVIDFEA